MKRSGIEVIGENCKHLPEVARFLGIPLGELKTLLKRKEIRVLLVWEKRRTRYGVVMLRRYDALGLRPK
ncbi:MAG: hypothetical protein KAT49_00785 [Methanomicrobia archaeon]|nr:hypothetical protein [Methanomicrobia archaeon]